MSLVVNLDAPELIEPVEAILPPGWTSREPDDDLPYFTLARRDGVSFIVEHEQMMLSGSSDLDVALSVLERQLRSYISLHAPSAIFVHAGVVAIGDQAIVIPGPSFTGKTTLVTAFVRAGAAYYSDEFAVIDQAGMIHPYAKPLSIRLDGLNQTDHTPEQVGATVGARPLRLGLGLITHFEPGAQWVPDAISGGEALLAFLSNTVPAQQRPEQAMSAIRMALEGALVLSGERGESAAVVDDAFRRLGPRG